MSTDLIETMKGEGWTFKRPCTAFMACSMRIHGFMPNGRPFAVQDEIALERYFGTQEQRHDASPPVKEQS